MGNSVKAFNTLYLAQIHASLGTLNMIDSPNPALSYSDFLKSFKDYKKKANAHYKIMKTT